MPGTYRLADHVVCRQTSGDLRMLFDRNKGVMYELNESASAVVGQLGDRPAPIDDVIATLLDEFEAPIEEIKADIASLLADFASAGLVVEE